MILKAACLPPLGSLFVNKCRPIENSWVGVREREKGEGRKEGNDKEGRKEGKKEISEGRETVPRECVSPAP